MNFLTLLFSTAWATQLPTRLRRIHYRIGEDRVGHSEVAGRGLGPWLPGCNLCAETRASWTFCFFLAQHAQSLERPEANTRRSLIELR